MLPADAFSLANIGAADASTYAGSGATQHLQLTLTGATVIPEPTPLVLLVTGSVAAIARRR